MQGDHWFCDSESDRENLINHLRALPLPFAAKLELGEEKIRTHKQNAALHVYLTKQADSLNESGLEMAVVLTHQADVPWSKDSAKELLWRPVQRALINKASTTEAGTADYSRIHQVLTRHLSQKLGAPYVPWPSLRNGE